ncbi:hypothetical protein SAMN04488563_4829 [Jiangella alkaliphila]|uniref:ECF sigma factor n=2 Tax=Jiangella alkaliphila TaxID=419479 RepID=A0A1H2L240_9ACTN|nr:hypothetical protein SAMN04488563_4829 [Jiangella alkaliphila]
MTNKPDKDQRAADAEAWLDGLDPATTPAEDTADLKAIAEAADQVALAERRLRAAVHTARVNGRSWARIGLALGVSRQSAHERHGSRANTKRAS